MTQKTMKKAKKTYHLHSAFLLTMLKAANVSDECCLRMVTSELIH